MPATKANAGSASQRYRPASEFDDATLAQKREYWRNKKREQRARLSKQRGTPTHCSRRGQLPRLNASGGNPTFSESPAVLSTLSQTKPDSDGVGSQRGHIVGHVSLENDDNQKEEWHQTLRVDKVLDLPQLIGSKEAEGSTATVRKASPRTVRKVVTAASFNGTQRNFSFSVPPVPVTRISNGSSTKTEPQPCMSMQSTTFSQTLSNSQGALENTDVSLVFPFVSVKTEGDTMNPMPQSGAKCAAAITQSTKGAGGAQPSLESDEEKAARRREQWRIKKREQRAKLAARIAKARDRMQAGDLSFQRQTAQKPVPASSSPLLQFQFSPRGKTPFPSIQRDAGKLQRGAARTFAKLQTDPIHVQRSDGKKRLQKDLAFDVGFVKKPAESQRKVHACTHYYTVTRGIARYKTPRQKIIEMQRNFLIQRNLRCKPPPMTSMLFTEGMPKSAPHDTPEQIIAKRREYWRTKKREQRAKLSMEMKVRLKERDSLMRRAKRYNQIVEEIREAKARNHSSESGLTHSSESFGGFIKEDGTLTANVPQCPNGQSPAGDKPEKKLQVVPKNIPIRINQLSPPLRPSQAKASFPQAVHLVKKPQRLMPAKPQTQFEIATIPNSQSLAAQGVGQLTLTHHQNASPTGPPAGSDPGGCVMKMVISSRAPPSPLPPLDPGLTEEERMAKKREYWRIKKREQRAARAVRLKPASAALDRRRAQRQELTTTSTDGTGNAQPLSIDGVSLTPHTSEIKQEAEAVAAADLNSSPPDINPPASPAGQQELDTSAGPDCQATTLLAVASMKKLLEESLSTVTECKSVQTDIKTEARESAPEQDAKPSLSRLFFEKDDMAPIAADLTLQIKSWRPDGDVLTQLKDSSEMIETGPDSATCSETGPSDCEPSGQQPLAFSFSVEAFDGRTSPRRPQRFNSKTNEHSPEPPKLHHIPDAAAGRAHVQQQLWAELTAAEGPAPGTGAAAAEQGGLTSLQRKREYWKLMKRQQRARLKANQRARQGGCSSRLISRDIQMPGLIINAVKAVGQTKPAPKPKRPVPSVGHIAGVLLVHRTSRNAERPLAIREDSGVSGGSSQKATAFTRLSGSPQRSQERNSQSTEVDPAPPLRTLKPPDNPLSNINLRAVQFPAQSPNSTLSPVEIPQTPAPSSAVSTLVPPKPVPGESEEDFLRRKREYWRIKKKEQRARKATRDKGMSPRTTSRNWNSISPSQNLQTQAKAEQGCDQWANSPEESEQLRSMPVEPDAEPFEFSDHVAPIEDDSELLFDHYEDGGVEEGALPGGVWRSHYLMDYDPLHQLLVCTVCGELQYAHSPEGAAAHIQEAHPHSAALEPADRQRILEAWDEQDY
ncbi:unnamed protein product [Menidia menidia]|uniref:(Atlantic silverside) hypothetical protein n=1 Tax=Menidia menidia TaxID=238744 RepID=A0A8S4BCG8_9TELE|nr:unnamed protein product [Menidia menidia]